MSKSCVYVGCKCVWASAPSLKSPGNLWEWKKHEQDWESWGWWHWLNPSVILLLSCVPQGVPSSSGIAAGFGGGTSASSSGLGHGRDRAQGQPLALPSATKRPGLHRSSAEIFNCWEQSIFMRASWSQDISCFSLSLFPCVLQFLLPFFSKPINFINIFKASVSMN